MNAKRALAGVFLLVFSALGHAQGCKGAQVSFAAQRSQSVEVDRLQATLYAEVQTGEMAALNEQLNRISRQVKAAAEPFAPEVTVQTRTFRSWPVYDAKRKVIIAWRGRYGVEVKGPVDGQTTQAIAALQRYLTLSGIAPVLSEPRRRAVREKLELALLEEVKRRARAYAGALGYRRAEIRSVRFAQGGHVGPVLRSMAKVMDTPSAPQINAGELQVSASASIQACLLN